MMAENVFTKVETDLFPKAEVVDLRGWGESLVLPDIDDKIHRVVSTGAKIRIVTNLSFRREHILRMLAEYNCIVDVSIDSADSEILRKIRGGARLELIKANLDVLARFYLKYHGTTKNLHFLTTVQSPALDTLELLVPLAAEHKISEIRLFPVSAGENSELSIEDKRRSVDKALERMGKKSREYNVNVYVCAKMGSLDENRSDMPACIHPWSYCHITYDGRVGFCDHLIGPAFDAYTVGNLKACDFRDIWNGPEWVDLRKIHTCGRFSAVERFQQCSWCYKNKYIDFEDCFHPGLRKYKVSINEFREALQ